MLMLLMIETGTRGGICQSTHRYVKANNKYMKNYDKKIESSYLTYLDANNLHGWTMSKKWSIKNENVIKNYNGNSDIGYFLEVDVEYAK